MLITHFYLHVPVTLAGERMRVARDITVAKLLREKQVNVVPGDLLDVRGKVIEAGKGKPARVTVNGRPMSFATLVHGGDAVVPHDGEDVTEPVVTRKVSIAPETKVVGSGRYLAINAAGEAGVRLDHLGALSKIVTKREILRKPVPTILVRTNTAPPKMVALTFDDGPWPRQTLQIAKVLTRYAVPATFFVLGRQVEKYPSIVRNLVQRGFLIANHSYSHPNLTRLGAKDVRDQLLWTQKLVTRAAKRRTYWMRPPGGNVNDTVNTLTRSVGMRPMNWNLDSHDWTRPGVKAIAQTVIKGVKPGYVVLLHDGGGDRTQTLKALPYIIKGLRAKGYSFVTLDEMFKIPPSRSRTPIKTSKGVAQAGG